MKQKLRTLARLLLGLMLVVFSLNFFFHFIPLPTPTEAMGKIEGAIYATGYWFQFEKILELVIGLLLLSGYFIPLALVLLAPLTVNIVVMHVFLDPAGMGPALVLLVLHLYLATTYFKYYRPFLVAKAD